MSYLKEFENDINDGYFRKAIKIDGFIYYIGNKTQLINDITAGNTQRYVGWIRKTDTEEIIIWEKYFENPNNLYNEVYTNCLICDNEDILIVGQVGYDESFLIRITKNGDFLWKKYFEINKGDYISHECEINKLANENFVLSISEAIHNTDGSVSSSTLYLFKLDGTGSVLLKKSIKSPPNNLTVVTDISENKLFFYGGVYSNSQKIFIINASNFSVIRSFEIRYGDKFHIQTLKYSAANRCLVISSEIVYFANNYLHGMLTVIPLNSDFSPNVSDSKSILISSDRYILIEINQYHIYTRAYTSYGGVLIKKFDYSLSNVWAKKIIYPPLNLPIRHFVTDEGIIILANNINGYLNLDLDSCITTQDSITYSFIEGINFSDFNTFIVSNSVDFSVISDDNCVISNVETTSINICPPTYDYNLKLESSNISVPTLIKNQPISGIDVDDINISNTGISSATLVVGTTISSVNGGNGITFKVLEEKIINPNIPENIRVAISGTPVQTGSFSPLIDINSPFVSNPNNIRIYFNVIDESINAEITGINLSPQTFFKDDSQLPRIIDYGTIKIKNNTNRAFTVPAGISIWNEPNNEFTFEIGQEIAFNPFQEIDNIPIRLITKTPDTLGTFESIISIQFGNPLISIQNPSLFKLAFKVELEPLNIQIIGMVDVTQPLTFIKGVYNSQTASIGNIIIENFTSTRNITLPKNTIIHDANNINGVKFRTKSTDTVLSPGTLTSVPIFAIDIAIALGNYICPIELTPDITNPNTFNFPFTVVEDILEVELVRAQFNYPILKKDELVSVQNIGSITLENKSLSKSFFLPAKTKIHWSNNMAGLVFRTNNTIDLEILAGTLETIEILLIPFPVAPNNFGNFEDGIYIKDVKNTDPYFKISFEVLDNGISIETNSSTTLQSPNFVLQAVGSKGNDSPKGLQLRWMFGGNLGQKHLPKGDLVPPSNYNNYNKPDDYVKVYKVPYTTNVRVSMNLDLSTSPSSIDDSKQCWIYKLKIPISAEDDSLAKFTVNQRLMHVYFRNKQKYNELRISLDLDPFTNPWDFINAYGENIIEIECKEELFFRVTPRVNKVNQGDLFFEVLSVEENKLVTPKYLSYRRKMTPTEIRSSKIFAENGRSVRFKKLINPIYLFEFEFYSDFIASASYWKAFKNIGSFALSITSNIKVLNGILGDINGKWLRYNDGEYVKKQNYIDKWNYTSTENDFRKGIREIVEKYIDKSNTDPTNPRAEEYININFSNPDPDYIPEEPGEDNGGTLVSYLDLLNISAMDYHVARLLGLGILDLSAEVIAENEYIYLTEYKTLKDPQNEAIQKTCQLLSVSLPTSVNTERLPIPIEISELHKGIPRKPNDDIPILYDDEGYTFDGKNRFISIINKPTPSLEINPSFFSAQSFWDASLYTLPIYGGLEYRVTTSGTGVSSKGEWEKPELSHDTLYHNVTSTGLISGFETVPIMLPESFGDPLYVHRQIKSGQYLYSTYGINIFSRATSSNSSSNITTTIKPKNTLLPPSDIKTWLIQPEKPLMFTSKFEQDKYEEINDEDKTFARVNFDYNASQDLVTHSIPPDSGIDDENYIREITKYFPDEYDIFADQVEVYFHSETPKIISASLYDVKNDTNQLCVVFKTKSYHFASTGETIYSVLPTGIPAQNFIGSLFVVNNKSYVIRDILHEIEGLKFIVYKEEVSQAILSGGSITANFTTLTMPVTSGNDLFMVTENMQSVPIWGVPSTFAIPLEFPLIKREIISSNSENGTVQKYLEKSRGFWLPSTIDKYLENGIHKGIYKIIIENIGLGNSLGVTEQGFYEMNNGYVRVFRNKSIDGNNFVNSRDVLKVIRTEHYSRTSRILYVYDSEFKFDDNGNPSGNFYDNEIQTEGIISINYYPSYFLYLYKDVSTNLTQDTVLPTGNSLVKHSIFGLRSVDIDNLDGSNNPYKSKFSTPSILIGQKIIDPKPPEQPEGSLYATRPDFYGKSTYSFTTKFTQRPYGVQFCRTDNNALLHALYEVEKVKEIFESLAFLGGNDETFLVNRWNNFFDYDYLSLTELPESEDLPGYYKTYPEIILIPREGGIAIPVSETKEIEKKDSKAEFPDVVLEEIPQPITSYAFPLPNNIAFFEGINDFITSHNINMGQSVSLLSESEYGTLKLNHVIIHKVEGANEEMLLIDFVKEVIDYTFVPLTEVPVIYQHVKSLPYLPLNKKQNIRDDSGYLLKPTSILFEMAPMMTKINEVENNTLFTDFTLVGTTNNLYFYASREIGSQMKMSELSPVLGPVKLVNSNPPEAPKIASALPVLANKSLGIVPKIKIEVQPYPYFAEIKRINLYQTINRLDAESILSMTHVKQIDISEVEISATGSWIITDDFNGYEQIPFGETLFYRVTVIKQIQYADSQVNPDGTQNIIIDYAPSQASKIMALMLVETTNPDSPLLTGLGTRPIDEDFVNDVTFAWFTACYRGTYHFYIMTSQGNWKEIARFIVNQNNDKVQLQVYNGIAADGNVWENKEILDIIENKISVPATFLNSAYNQFSLFDEDGNRKYYHFKVIAENTSNMFSTQGNILTLFTDEVWDDLQGISSDGTTNGMIIEKTFIIK